MHGSGADLVTLRPEGLYCAAGDFYIDPWRSVAQAVLTHAHADHARSGSAHYVVSSTGLPIFRARLGAQASLLSLPYGQVMRLGDTRISLHPAGHILGSAQIRIEHGGDVWVVSGDYKRDLDPSCEAFEPLRCDCFITEATFALPCYRWPPFNDVIDDIVCWVDYCARLGIAAVLGCYALGKAQRLLAGLLGRLDQPVLLHGAMTELVGLYRAHGVPMQATESVPDARQRGVDYAGRLVLAPPSATSSAWMKRFRGAQVGFASGWMQIRGNRRRRAVDRGFVLSDHADWQGLLRTIEQTGARRILATHGSSDALVRTLRERGLQADALALEPRDASVET